MSTPPPACTAYRVGSHTVLQCSHTLPPLLGHCPADTYILHPPPSSSSSPPLPSLIFPFRHHPSLSTSSTLHTQTFTFLTSLLTLRTQRHQPLTHGDLIHFEGDTHIGDEVNRGVLIAYLPPASLDVWVGSMGGQGGGEEGWGGRREGVAFCLLVTEGEMRLVERCGATRLLALKAWREAERERRERGDPGVHFYPFPVCSDLSRSASLVALPPTQRSADVSLTKPKVERPLSTRGQLQQKLRERREAKEAEKGQLQSAATATDGEGRESKRSVESVHVPSMLDKLRVYRVYGSAVHREGQTIRLEVGDEGEMKAAMRKAAADSSKGDKRPLVLCTGLPKDGGAVKVWLPPLSDTSPAATTAAAASLPSSSASVAVLSAEADAAAVGGGSGYRTYGSFLCLFPSPSSTVDEGKESEDGYTLFLTLSSYEAVQRYLARGLKLAMLSDSPTGLHFDIAWSSRTPAPAAAPSSARDEEPLTADWLLTEVRKFVNDEAARLTAARLTEQVVEAPGRLGTQRQSLIDFTVLQCRIVEAQLKMRREQAAVVAEPLGVVDALVTVQRDGGVQAQVHHRQRPECEHEETRPWSDAEALMRKVAVPSALLAAAGGIGGAKDTDAVLSLSLTFGVR